MDDMHNKISLALLLFHFLFCWRKISFDGKTLKVGTVILFIGVWKTGLSLVKIQGEADQGNTFLVGGGVLKDFDLTLDCKIDAGNSGISTEAL